MSKEEVEINSFINEFYVKTIITQKIRNETENPLEIQIHFDQKEKSLFTSFSAKIGDLIQVKSKIIKLKKAEEKYTDNISSGNGAIFVCRDPFYKNRIIINMGNIPPKQDLIFTSEHIQYLESSDKFYFEFFKNLPIIDCKNGSIYFSPEITGKVEIKMKNKIKICNKYFSNNLNIIEEKFIENENYYLIKYNFKKSTDINNDNETKVYKRKDSDEDIKKNKINKIYFEIEQNPLIMYCQKSLLKENEKSFIIQYKHIENNFKKKNIDNLKLSPALFIFLVDQSCSMRGEPMEVTCKALVLFLQSLPPGSYYQIIGFGTEYTKYNSTYVLMIDVDKFKLINDNFGHLEGDRALVILANALKAGSSNRKEKCFLARYGGDEFIIIASCDDEFDVDELVKNLHREVEKTHEITLKYHLSVSIGYSKVNDNESILQVIESADERMYENKSKKKAKEIDKR